MIVSSYLYLSVFIQSIQSIAILFFFQYIYIYVCIYIYFKIGRSTKKFVFFRIYLFILFLHTCMFPAKVANFTFAYVW